MSEFKVFKPGHFTIMPDDHLHDVRMSLKARGLLSTMLDLPDDWDYSIKGLVSLCKESYDTVRGILNELKSLEYIEIIKHRGPKGTFRYKYLIFINPSQKRAEMAKYPDSKNPYVDNPDMEKPNMENYDQYNNNKYIDKKDKIDKTIKHNILTEELINLKYITKDDISSFYFNVLFNDYLDAGYTYGQLLGSIHYIVPRVISRSFIDDDGNEIKNKYGYFKNSMESNIRKLSDNLKELYPENSKDEFWNDYDFLERR